MGNKFRWVLLFSVVVTAVYIFAAPFVFQLLFPNYMDAVWYSQLYALCLLTIPAEPFQTYLSSKKLTQELYIIYLFYSFFQVGTMVIGVIYWGLVGLVVARIVTRFAMGGLGYVLYYRAVRAD